MTAFRRIGPWLALVLAVCAPFPAGAQVYDHLQCFKIKDPNNFRAAADLSPVYENLAGDADCRIKVRSKEYCTPVEKSRTALTGDSKDAPSVPMSGQGLGNGFLCYKIRCREPGVQPDSLQLTDQFGTRNLTGFKTSKLCAPAIVGPAPPTTTTTTLPVRFCDTATEPSCDGACPSQFACTPALGGGCSCEPVDVFLPCGAIAGSPDCLGSCAGSTQSCIDNTGACVCSVVNE